MSNDELNALLNNLIIKAEDMFPVDSETSSSFEKLARTTAIIASEIFVEGIKQYEEMKAQQ